MLGIIVCALGVLCRGLLHDRLLSCRISLALARGTLPKLFKPNQGNQPPLSRPEVIERILSPSGSSTFRSRSLGGDKGNVKVRSVGGISYTRTGDPLSERAGGALPTVPEGGAIIAWHEVPGKAPSKEPSHRVRYDRGAANPRRISRRHGPFPEPGRYRHTVPYGTVLSG